jgi:ADP-ribose pyrophosphatase
LPRLYPDSPQVGVGSLVLENGRILLVKRAYSPGRGLWSIPGGHVELGESVLEAAVRELREETGLEGEPLGVVNVDDAITIDSRGVRYHYVLVTVLLRVKGGELRPGGDAVEVGFFTLEEAKRMPLTPSVRGLIEKIERGMLCLEKPIPVRKYSPPD